MTRSGLFFLLVVIVSQPLTLTAAQKSGNLYLYTLPQSGTTVAYDEALAVACLQGIINRKEPNLYVLSTTNNRPAYWLSLLSTNRHWLQGWKHKSVQDLTALVKLAEKRLKGAIIWDPDVPASVNVATTMAGIQDAIVLSPELAEHYLPKWRLTVLADLRGKFTGAETGSKKNDAYRFALRNYLAPGRSSSHLLCLFEDAFSARTNGDTGYVVTRDWAVKNRAFVFDLSPWGDEKPGDDPAQRLGLDLETYHLILTNVLHQTAGRHMTELTGFFAFGKYADQPAHHSLHKEVPTEWETVWLISPYNFYQNTISSDCFNQSFHSHFPRRPLTQKHFAAKVPLEKKAYVSFLMADYDSATPLYDFLPKHWEDPDRGKLPLAWGINPNLLETYPDLIAYYYETATPRDTFTSDASAAGYMNPNRIRKEYLPVFVRHNQAFFREADMSMAPMVLDRDQPSSDVKDAFQKFAPGGYATIVADVNGGRGVYPQSQVWKGMPILELINDTCNSKDSGQIADVLANAIKGRGNKVPGFYLFRVVWVDPSTIRKAVAELQQRHPEISYEVVDLRTLFNLFKQTQP